MGPIIGISSTVENHNNIPSVHVHEKYVHAVIQASGTPIVLPLGNPELAERWISLCDGIILSSGEDVDPASFNANPIPQIQKTNSKRDQLEISLINEAVLQQKPILAICRGITMLNVALGGTLIQDIPSSNVKAINHYQQAERPNPTHDIKIEENSHLFQILGRTKYRVNSMHHQAIDQLAPTLKKVATAPDGVIEAVEGIQQSPFILGIQWHPEEMAIEDPSMLQLFKYFVSKCNHKE